MLYCIYRIMNLLASKKALIVALKRTRGMRTFHFSFQNNVSDNWSCRYANMHCRKSMQVSLVVLGSTYKLTTSTCRCLSGCQKVVDCQLGCWSYLLWNLGSISSTLVPNFFACTEWEAFFGTQIWQTALEFGKWRIYFWCLK